MYSPSLRFSHRLIDKNSHKHSITPLNIHSYNQLKNKKIPLPKFPHPQNPSNDDDDDDDDHQHSPFPFPKLFGRDMNSDVYTTKNHIYFKTDVTKESIEIIK